MRTPREPLSRTRIVEAAAQVADAGGLAAVTMRSVGKQLGVEAMSLYHHVGGKDELLDELADWIFTRVDPPAPTDPWRPAMVARANSARQALGRHPWALGLIESRRHPGPATLRHHDAVLGCLRHNGFPVAMAAHAFSVLDSYVYGFVLTEVNLPMSPGEPVDDLVEEMGIPAQEYPHLMEMVAELVIGRDYAYANEFRYGLDLVLDGIEARLDEDRHGCVRT